MPWFNKGKSNKQRKNKSCLYKEVRVDALEEVETFENDVTTLIKQEC